MCTELKPIVWIEGEIKTPPFSTEARIEAGALQLGEKLSMPRSRPMPSIGSRCHELRINDEDKTWRIIYRLDADAIVIGEVFAKKDRATPKKVVDNCKRRFRKYDEDSK